MELKKYPYICIGFSIFFLHILILNRDTKNFGILTVTINATITRDFQYNKTKQNAKGIKTFIEKAAREDDRPVNARFSPSRLET